MRTRRDLEDEVLDLVRAELDVGQGVPSPDAELDEYLDSLQRVHLLLAIEDRFHVRFEPADDFFVHTLADTVRMLHRKLAES